MTARVKICGLTRREDAQAAAAAGAWALGVIFASESPRRVGHEQAAGLFREVPARIERVGVFVNNALDEMEAAVDACGLTAIQLHGDESPDLCAEARERLGVKVIKSIRVSGPGSLDGVVQFDTDYILLDTYHPGQRGGTGESFDWSLAAGLPERERSGRIILAGGLRPDNIVAASRAVRPFALDVSSGVESEPGIKDHTSLERLFSQLTTSEQ